MLLEMLEQGASMRWMMCKTAAVGEYDQETAGAENWIREESDGNRSCAGLYQPDTRVDSRDLGKALTDLFRAVV